ncbi:MAG: Gfo/Idh/MocA family oxidoreductase, partial [Dehalococcoidia bacterium]
MDRIRLGIIGASPERGWGKMTHVPAIEHLPEIELTAVCTSREETASAAREAYGARYGFSDYHELVDSDEVDAVTIVVRVPWHREMALAALAAGKHVYCEWPLAQNIEEGAEMVAAANASGLTNMIGLQGRFAPWARYVKELVDDGTLGRVYSVNARLGIPHNYQRPGMAWAAKKESGNHMLSIYVPHQLELVFHTVGRLMEGSAQVGTQFTPWVLEGEPGPIDADAPDNVAVHGTLDGGASLSFHAAFVPAASTGWRMEVYGEKGTIIATANSGGHTPVNHLEGALDGGKELKEIQVPERFREVPADVPSTPALNVAHAYRHFVQAVTDGTPAEPDFAYGLDTM